MRDYIGTTRGVIKGDTRSSGCSSYELQCEVLEGGFYRGLYIGEDYRVMKGILGV